MFARSQSVLSPVRGLKVHVVHSLFFNSDTSRYLELDFGVYPALVSLTRTDSVFHGAVEMNILVRRKLTGEVHDAERLVLPVALRDTALIGGRSARVGRTGFVLPVGTYNLNIIAIDSLNRQRRDSVSFDIGVDRMTAATSMSDVDLCASITPSTRTDDPFYKNSFDVVPNPSLYFGLGVAPVAYTYLELYHLKVNEQYRVKLVIVDQNGKVVKERVRDRKFTAANAVDVSTLNIPAVESGKYIFAATLSDTVGYEFARSERPIFIYNPGVKPSATARIEAVSAQFAGMTVDELDDEFRKTQYFHSEQDGKTYEQLTDAEGKRKFLSQLWAEIESGNRTAVGLSRAIWRDRIAQANQRFSSMRKEGWKTDRGRVLIMYGDPSEVDRKHSTESSKPYEIWYYYQIENGVQFIFIDRTGFGDYVLVHSTKRGELEDDSWEQYLK